MDQGEAIKLMDQYFERMKKLRSLPTSTSQKDGLPSRIKFMLQDCIELRTNGWQPRQFQLDSAPKTINELRTGEVDPKTSSSGGSGGAGSLVNAATTTPFMLKMYQQLNEQPNMSLLHAIGDLTLQTKKRQLEQQLLQQQQQHLTYGDPDELESGQQAVDSNNNTNANNDDETSNESSETTATVETAVPSSMHKLTSLSAIPMQMTVVRPSPTSTPTPPPSSQPPTTQTPPPASVGVYRPPQMRNQANMNAGSSSASQPGVISSTNPAGSAPAPAPAPVPQPYRPPNYGRMRDANGVNNNSTTTTTISSHLDQYEYPSLNNTSANQTNDMNRAQQPPVSAYSKSNLVIFIFIILV